jgi:hypothetical protein
VTRGNAGFCLDIEDGSQLIAGQPLQASLEPKSNPLESALATILG